MTPPAHAPALLARLTLALGMILVLPPALDARPQDSASTGPRSIAAAVADGRGSANPARDLDALEDLLARGDADAARLCRGAHLALTMALVAGDTGNEAERVGWIGRAESYARAMHASDPDAPEARFLIGAALGLRTSHVGTRERIGIAAEIREHADAVLLADPAHPGGLHLMGRLNAAAMRLNPFVRFLARTVFGGEALEGASWATAEAAFRGAINAEPGNSAHHIGLALVLRDTGREEEARAQLESVIAADDVGAREEHYRREAIAALATIQ